MAGHDERGFPRILIADDDESMTVLGAMLQYAKYRVEYAHDGEEVLRQWIGRSYNLILMDVGMSPMDGLTASVIIRMKEQALCSYTPIIGLTAETSEQSRRDCFAAGMDGFVPKPVIFRELLDLMEQILLHQRRRVPERPGCTRRPGHMQHDAGTEFACCRAHATQRAFSAADHEKE